MSAETEQYGYPFEAGAQELLDMSAEDLERQAAQAIYVGRHMMYQTSVNSAEAGTCRFTEALALLALAERPGLRPAAGRRTE
jgi:hypothetical protein